MTGGWARILGSASFAVVFFGLVLVVLVVASSCSCCFAQTTLSFFTCGRICKSIATVFEKTACFLYTSCALCALCTRFARATRNFRVDVRVCEITSLHLQQLLEEQSCAICDTHTGTHRHTHTHTNKHTQIYIYI